MHPSPCPRSCPPLPLLHLVTHGPTRFRYSISSRNVSAYRNGLRLAIDRPAQQPSTAARRPRGGQGPRWERRAVNPMFRVILVTRKNEES